MRMLRLMGVVLVCAPVMVLAQAQAKPTEKKEATKPAMQHDMSTMGHDSGMTHDMGGMGQGAGMGMGEMKSGWQELDAFHTLLMSVWHPARKDSLTMARTLAPTLAASAAAWEKSKGPAACDDGAARKALPGIVADAKAYATVAAGKADDAAVKAALTKVHDGFETVGKPCMQAARKATGGVGMGAMMGAKTGWKEFDAFHALVMSVSAAANKGDLKPAREKAAELTRSAEALAASKGPMRCDNTEARKWIPVVVRHAKSLTKATAESGSDATVKTAVEMTHKEFQKVARPCLSGTPELSDRDRARLQSASEARLQLNHPAVQKKP